NLLLSLIGIEPTKEQELHSAEELRYLIEESSKSGMIELNEQEMIENVFVFQETMASEVMIPRGKIIGLEISMKPDMIVETVIEQGYSRMPVYKETLDNIIGIVYAKDILTMMSFSDLIILPDIVRPITFIQETDKIHSLLTKMQKQRFHMAVVLDEFGGTAGLVTLEDIMEELVGEIQDEYDEEKPIVESKNAEEWTISADASIADVNEFLPYPFPESDEYQTVGGMINHITGRIPSRYSRVNLPPVYICLIDEANTRKVESVTLKVDKDRLFSQKD
ncbi:MAG: hemolysin family protein, partial [Candidatus Kapaibacteriota bacterium]